MSEFSRGFVLAFHEIPPERLAEFVDCLRPAQPVHLSELVQRSKERRSTSGLFAIEGGRPAASSGHLAGGRGH